MSYMWSCAIRIAFGESVVCAYSTTEVDHASFVAVNCQSVMDNILIACFIKLSSNGSCRFAVEVSAGKVSMHC